jgi:osmotically-inducible protein OsmY
MAIVTISRGTYTGGIAVAEGLAAALGHPCVSREVVVDAARDYGVPEAELQSTLEEPPHFWEKTPGRIAASLNLVRAALLKRARDGDLVYHGYAGHLLLGGIAHVLRVRVIADRESRIRAAMEDKGMDHRAAADFVKKLDNQLIKWTRFLYGVEWQDPSLYDVVLNLEHMSIESAVKTIAQITRMDDFRPTADSRKAFEDLLLSSNVWAALTIDKRTRSANVRVAADDGVVFVTGLADNERTLTAVQEVAAAVDGVREVESEVGIGRTWQW